MVKEITQVSRTRRFEVGRKELLAAVSSVIKTPIDDNAQGLTIAISPAGGMVTFVEKETIEKGGEPETTPVKLKTPPASK